MKIELVKVIVSRHAGVDIEKTVKPWEVRVLKRIHGKANVQEIDRVMGVLMDEKGEEVAFDPEREYGALMRKYGTATDEKSGQILPQVYEDAEALEDAFYREQKQSKPAKTVRAPEATA